MSDVSFFAKLSDFRNAVSIAAKLAKPDTTLYFHASEQTTDHRERLVIRAGDRQAFAAVHVKGATVTTGGHFAVSLNALRFLVKGKKGTVYFRCHESTLALGSMSSKRVACIREANPLEVPFVSGYDLPFTSVSGRLLSLVGAARGEHGETVPHREYGWIFDCTLIASDGQIARFVDLDRDDRIEDGLQVNLNGVDLLCVSGKHNLNRITGFTVITGHTRSKSVKLALYHAQGNATGVEYRSLLNIRSDMYGNAGRVQVTDALLASHPDYTAETGHLTFDTHGFHGPSGTVEWPRCKAVDVDRIRDFIPERRSAADPYTLYLQGTGKNHFTMVGDDDMQTLFSSTQKKIGKEG